MQTDKYKHGVDFLPHMTAASWKYAVGSVLSAATRLHHYRDVHTRMMREALCKVDCSAKQDECTDE